MRAVTELGFTASVFPERAAVQEVPGEGESFFDTLNRAGESAKDAGQVTDDKPETAEGKSRDAETSTKKTQGKDEASEVSSETEKPEQTEEAPDVVAQMLALGRMLEVVQPEQNVEVNASELVGEAAEQVQAVSVETESGESRTQSPLQLLTPVENGEEVVLTPVENEGVAVDAENFADTITKTLSDALEVQQEQPAETIAEANLQTSFEITEEVQTEEIPVQIQDTEMPEIQAEEEMVRMDRAQPIEVERNQSNVPSDMPETEFVARAESTENTDFSQSFAGEGDNLGSEEETTFANRQTEAPEIEIDDGTAIESGAMQQTLRSRFSLDNAVQQIDNTELAQAIEKAIDRFAEDFRLAEVDTQQITIRLDPEELGSVSITVAAENNALTAKIVTDNKEAASLLSAQIEQFLEAMEQKGIKVEKAEVTYNSQLDLGGQAPNEHSGGARENNRTVQNISAVEMVEAEQAGRSEENTVPIAAVQDEVTNYYVFDDKYVPNHVYKV